jgi:chromosome segregation protein
VAFVSRGGVVWDGGVAAGGRPSDADRGLLRREHELRALREERSRLEAVFAETGEEKLRVLRARDEAARGLAEAEETAARLSQSRFAAEARQEGLARETGTAREEHQARAAETAGLAAQEQAAAEAERTLAAALAVRSAESSTASERLAGLEIELASLERQREEQAAAAQAARNGWFELSARQAAVTADLARVETERAELGEALRARGREIEQAGDRRGQALSERETIAVTLETRRAREAELRAKAERVAERTREARERLEAEDHALAELRREQMELAELVHHLEVEKLTVHSELEKTLERLRVEYGVDLESFAPAPLPEGETWDAAEAETRLEGLRGRYRELGPVNLLALEEFNKKKERHTFLTTQRDDLQQARAQLLEAIERINTTASQLFLDTFGQVEVHFQETFGTLFEGGECGLRMVGEDPLECEIEIMARPRGKNLQSILLLSGGERALTAIALLFAIYLVKPSPFCILDEVDAPLDDANVERFVRMLQRFSARTQFIVVTHNKKTMEIAEGIYGVTMQEPGVSKLVSVRFANPRAGSEEEPSGNGHGRADEAGAPAEGGVVEAGEPAPAAVLAEAARARPPVRVRRPRRAAAPLAPAPLAPEPTPEPTPESEPVPAPPTAGEALRPPTAGALEPALAGTNGDGEGEGDVS